VSPHAAATPTLPRERGSEEARVWSALAEINDPEMPINLVDLGVVYGVELAGRTVRVRLTFTAMGCPASEMIMGDIRERLLAEPGVDQVVIDVVWDPPWSSSRLTPEGREVLLAWGLSV
jgi:metal-sulfur cluster biosynthetic enzyme